MELDTIETVDDAGYLLTENDLVVDIDNLDKSVIEKMIDYFNIQTEYRWTDRGIHFYFKKPKQKLTANGVCALGFPVENKFLPSHTNVVVKRAGIERPVINQGVRETLPDVLTCRKGYNELLGLDEGDGRNNKLFQHKGQISHIKDKREVLNFINNYIFAEPLVDDEISVVTREQKMEAIKDAEYQIASHLIQDLGAVNYQGVLYFKRDDDFESDPRYLYQMVYEYVGDQKTRYVNEIIEQIKMRAKIIDDEAEFVVRFKNGILKDGQFLEIDYKEFTPYNIAINYYPDAAPVADVDNYINHLTNSDEDYKKLIFEVLGHCLITNREFKRVVGKIFFFIGGGGNGKGTLLQIIKEILDTRNVTGLDIGEMADERYLISMKGKLANLGDDVADNVIDGKMMKILKNISTCDFITSRALYQGAKSATFTTSLIFTSNHMIKSFEKGESWKRRAMWLPMYTVVKDKNKDQKFISKQTAPEALEYYVSQMVAGYMRLYENNGYTVSQAVEEENVRYHQENNGMTLFLSDYSKKDLLGKRYKSVYDNEYIPWVEENGGNEQSQKAFKEAVMEEFGLSVGSRKIDGKTGRVFVEMKEDVESE